MGGSAPPCRNCESLAIAIYDYSSISSRSDFFDPLSYITFPDSGLTTRLDLLAPPIPHPHMLYNNPVNPVLYHVHTELRLLVSLEAAVLQSTLEIEKGGRKTRNSLHLQQKASLLPILIILSLKVLSQLHLRPVSIQILISVHQNVVMKI